MTTFDALVDRTINRLESIATRDRVNLLDGALTAGATTVTLLDSIDVDVVRGAEIEIGYERMYVRSVSSQDLTVIRGWNGTTATTHADGDVVHIEPRWARQDILDALTTAAQALPRSVFGVTTVDLTPTSEAHAFDLTGALGKDVIRLLQIWRKNTDGAAYLWRDVRATLLRDMDTSLFTSGYAVQLPPAWTYGSTTTLRCTYAWALDSASITSSTDLESDLGAPSVIGDALVYAAGGHLLMGAEVARNDVRAHVESRFAEEVPPSAISQTAEAWLGLSQRRIAEASEQLVSKYPWRSVN